MAKGLLTTPAIDLLASLPTSRCPTGSQLIPYRRVALRNSRSIPRQHVCTQMCVSCPSAGKQPAMGFRAKRMGLRNGYGISTFGQPMVQNQKPVADANLTNLQILCGQTMLQNRPTDGSSHNLFFGSPRKSRAWPGEQAPPALWCPARKRGGKARKKCMYQNRVSMIGFVSNEAQLRSTNKGARRTCGGVFRRHQILVEKR